MASGRIAGGWQGGGSQGHVVGMEDGAWGPLGGPAGLCDGFRPVSSQCEMQAPARAADVACARLRASFCGLPPLPPVTSAASLQLCWPHARGSSAVPVLSEERTADRRGRGLGQQRAGRRFRLDACAFPGQCPRLLPAWGTGGPLSLALGAPGAGGGLSADTRVRTCSQTPLSPTRGLDEPCTGLFGAETTQPSQQPRGAPDLCPAPRPFSLQPPDSGFHRPAREARDPAGRHGELLPRGDVAPGPVFVAGGPSAPGRAEPTSHAWAELARLCWEPALRSARWAVPNPEDVAPPCLLRLAELGSPLLRRAMCRETGRGASPDHTCPWLHPAQGASWDATTQPWESLW